MEAGASKGKMAMIVREALVSDSLTRKISSKLGPNTVVRASRNLDVADMVFPGGIKTLAFHVIPELRLRDPKIVAAILARFQHPYVLFIAPDNNTGEIERFFELQTLVPAGRIQFLLASDEDDASEAVTMMLRTNKDAMRRSRQQMWFQECGRQATSPETVRAIVEQWAEGLGIPPSELMTVVETTGSLSALARASLQDLLNTTPTDSIVLQAITIFMDAEPTSTAGGGGWD